MNFSIENRARLAFAGTVLLGLAVWLIWHSLVSGRFTTYQIVTQDSVSGLIPGAPVEFHGVDVGTVNQVELTGPRTVRILLDVEKDAPITRATVATITARGLATRGFTGYVYILLEDTGTDEHALTAARGERYPRIPSTPSRYVSLDTAIMQVNQNVQVLTEMARALLDDKTIASLRNAVDNLQQVSRMLAENQESLSAIIANTGQASERLGPLLDSSNNTMKGLERVSRMLAQKQEHLSSIIANTERASGQLGPLLESSSQTINALQLQVLPEAYRTMANLNKLANSMDRFTVKINRDPSILVRGSTPPPLGPGETK
ncbi:ABC-type transporter Mla maintaining outer membrane lipid asymmetry, component MlaD [Microbulbifer donghaiensis]|uniref:ABC-type transporter Mla maintaining outer membrane lipid asymmetry, component MlaD n=1 Tax=Microbulbifer donghaiensis TaxID=494016 RepID=A0A1M4USN5_9GAMM|nr:MlaD family protein [Microbulbifer donghaiensis]SHE59752.1 ABC-type transporter Mla maintaining outer membrane lipid asymmetry, component MlaD [Microbulbifer donghaiensis]